MSIWGTARWHNGTAAETIALTAAQGKGRCSEVLLEGKGRTSDHLDGLEWSGEYFREPGRRWLMGPRSEHAVHQERSGQRAEIR